jgi:large subunit ribosomal protein L23
MKAALIPHITEKSYRTLEGGATYTFKVNTRLEKGDIKNIIEKQFGVSVVDVNIVRLPGKVRRFKGVVGKTNQIKKAIVRLKKGDTIPGFEIEDAKPADKE